MLPTRRAFLHTLAAPGAGAALTSPPPPTGPLQRHGASHLRLSIAAYSYRKYLDLKQKPKPSMTLDDFIDLAADMNLDAVELTAYYFPQTSPEYLGRLKARCT